MVRLPHNWLRDLPSPSTAGTCQALCLLQVNFARQSVEFVCNFTIAVSVCRFKSALLTDKRIRIMNEIIVGIRVIKMYAWEHAFKRVVSKLRKYVPEIVDRPLAM